MSSAVPTISTPRGEARRRAFLDAAGKVFLAQGLGNASVNDVVRLAGGSLATLYQQFGSKEGLFLAMFEELLVGLVKTTLGGLHHLRQGTALDFTPPYPRVSFVEGIRQAAGVDVLADSEESLRQFLRRSGESAEAVATMSGGRLLV